MYLRSRSCKTGGEKSMSVFISIPRVVAERIKREAEREGVSVKEYVVELLTQNLNPVDRAKEYIKVSLELLAQAKEELAKGNIRQSSEKTWGAVALAIKAYAYWRDKRRLESYHDLWKYKNKVASELGEWVGEVFREAGALHVCLYEGWCTKEDVEKAIPEVEKLVNKIAESLN